MKKNGTCGSHTNKKIKKRIRRGDKAYERLFFIFFLKFSLTSLFDLWKSDRQNSSRQEVKCSTQRGLPVGTKNTGFH